LNGYLLEKERLDAIISITGYRGSSRAGDLLRGRVCDGRRAGGRTTARGLGDVAIATNPFELFLDYGVQIKGRSKAVLTFLSQLTCDHHGYLPTRRAVAGGDYSAVNHTVGPRGGRVLVDESVKAINSLWP
jgi:hypothetical protein